MTQAGLVTCNQCHKQFKTMPNTVDLPDGGQKNFFQCPHCGTRFVYAEITPHGMEIFRRIQTIVSRRGRKPDDRNLEQLTTQLKFEISKYTERADLAHA
jgi:uncharacterized Zn-finger protein